MPHVLELYEMLEKSFHCQFPGGLNVKVYHFFVWKYISKLVYHILVLALIMQQIHAP